MERGATQVEDLRPAVVMPELQSTTDIQPDASLKAKKRVDRAAGSFSRPLG